MKMKYRPSEQKLVNQIQKEIDKLQSKLEKLELNKLLWLERHNTKTLRIEKLQEKLQARIDNIDEKVKKRCKHIGTGRRRWPNMRDDASFENYVACEACDEVIWDECGPRTHRSF